MADLVLMEALRVLSGMDPGEIQLLVAADETPSLIVLSGDLRMIRSWAAADEPLVREARERMKGRLVFLPQLLAPLSTMLGLEQLDRRWRKSGLRHKSLTMIFGSTPPVERTHFEEALTSIIGEVEALLGPGYLFSFP